VLQRRVVTGTRQEKQVVVEDEALEAVELGGVAVAAIWKTAVIPTIPNDGHLSPPARVPADVQFPDPGGVLVGTFTVPPNSTVQSEGPVHFDAGRPGYHHTDSVDIDLIVDGQIAHEIEDGSEVLLNKGDWIVVNGTGHAWHNRSDAPATVLSVVCGAHRTSA
jgi:quercetin dioxygenase-like cupin family protein